MKDRKMFFRIVGRALIERRGRMMIALTALIVGAAVASAMLSVYYDAGRKMSREIRAYGANVMVAPLETGEFIGEGVLDDIRGSQSVIQVIGAAPYLYIVAVASGPASNDPNTVVVVGTLFDEIKKVAPWWQVDGSLVEDASDKAECVIGAAVARQLKVRTGDKVAIAYGESGSRDANGAREFVVSGVVTTGGDEDNQIFARLADVQRLAALTGRMSAVGVSAVGDRDQIERFAIGLSSRLESARAVPIRQIADSEGMVLGKLKLMTLLVTVLILAGAALSVGTTLTALVIERRREIGTLKAIGAADSDLLRLFLSELGVMSACGAVAGYAIGLGFAQLISMKLFGSGVAPRIPVFAAVLAISLVVAVLSAVVPIRRIREVQPATILRGD
jgi:putative ABC transport system permease protein